MKSDLHLAVTQLAAERNLSKEVVIEAIEAALISAYKRDEVAAGQNIAVRLNPTNGEVRVFVQRAVVEKPADTKKEISLQEARKIKRDAQLGDTIEAETLPYNAGRIAAQTAKQVVMQRLREAERERVYEEYTDKSGDIVSGLVQRVELHQVIVDLGRAEAIMPDSEQVPTERYRPGMRLKFFLVEVRRSVKGPEIVVSRTHKNLLRRLFELEVPEIFSGVVEIKAIAREPGSRSKVAVSARQAGVDPVGSCVGLRGIRIQNIVNEVQGERIDVILWHKDMATFVANALSPSPVLRVLANEGEKSALVVVPDRQLSLAIGKDGQNARLAAKLLGWHVDIKSASEAETLRLEREAQLVESRQATQKVARIDGEAPAPSVAVEALKEGVSAAVQAPAAQVEATALAPEELALAEMELGGMVEAPSTGPEEAVTAQEITEDVWKIPVVSQEPAQVRFAEDIMPSRGQQAKVKKGKKESTEEGQKSKSRAAKPARTRWEQEDLEGQDQDSV